MKDETEAVQSISAEQPVAESKLKPSDSFIKEMQSVASVTNTPITDRPMTDTMVDSQPTYQRPPEAYLPNKKRLNIKFIVSILLLLLFLAGGALWFYLSYIPSSLINYSVSQNNPAYSISFYPDAKSITGKGNHYLVSTDAQGKMTEVWLTNINGPQGYGSNPIFNYNLNGQSETGMYVSRQDIYATDIRVDGHYYQISITSQRPVSLNDAKAIFSSFRLN